MKRTIRYLLITLFFIMLSFHADLGKAEARSSANASCAITKVNFQHIEKGANNKFQLTLPFNLKLIEEEAFEGTAFTNILIPESVQEIGAGAFDQDENLVISGFDGSFVQQWAYHYHIRFNILEQIRRANKLAGFVYVPERKEKKTSRIPIHDAYLCICNNTKHVQNTSRSIGEIKASYYVGNISVYVRSRYFP